jgi:hypothetical protein
MGEFTAKNVESSDSHFGSGLPPQLVFYFGHARSAQTQA